MAEPNDDLAAYIEQAAALMGVPATSEHLPGIVRNFANFRALIETVEGFDTPDAPDPPGILRP